MLSTLRSLLHRRLQQIPSSRVRVYSPRLFSTSGGSNSNNNNNDNNSADPWSSWNPSSGSEPADPTSDLPWSDVSSWSTGLTKDHFDGAPVGQPVSSQESQTQPQPQSQLQPSAREIAIAMDEEEEIIKMLEQDNQESKKFVDGWHDRMMDTYKLMKKVREPGVRGEYLKDSDKKEMYRLYKEDPEVNNVEKLAKQFRVMRQRVHAIIWLKEMEEEEEKKRGKPLDDSVEILLDNFPE